MNYKNIKFTYRIIILLLLQFAYSCSISPTIKTGSWGDQGNGTYKNPILNADYPDVDVEQLGDSYYMISSKQHMSPGMVILESKDMVNWTIIGHVWNKLSWAPEYNWDKMSGYPFGVWAGDLVFHDNKWFCYQIDFKHGLYMSSAPAITGPWTNPIQLMSTEMVYDDPCVFFDEEEHQAYLLCNTQKKLSSPDRKEVGNENRIFKLSWDGTTVLDSGKVAFTGIGAEAAKIYKIDGKWYIFYAEWYKPDPHKPSNSQADKNDRKQIVLRSLTNSIYGPYEKKIVMERGNSIIRSCSQGALMQAPDSSWWYTHQLIQNTSSPFQGRPQCLEPVQWIDGWPLIGEDVDNDGIGEPVLKYKKPIQGFPVIAPPTDDEFNSKKLGFQWEWNHNPRDQFWSLDENPGYLRLKAGIPIQYDKNIYSEERGYNTTFWRSYNTLSQRIMGTTKGTAVAKFNLSGMAADQRAGFVRFGGVYHLLGIHKDKSGKRHLFFMNNKGIETTGPEIPGDDLFIRTKNNGNKAFFEYSINGKQFVSFGPEFTLEFGRWTGDRLGFFCWNKEKEEGYIDIDYFHYDYDGPKKKIK